MIMWISYKTIVKKELLRFMRIWVQTIFPPIIITSLYLLIFGRIIGDRVGLMDNIQYIQYIIPGIILMSVITNSYANTVASFFMSKFNHSIEELKVSPTPPWVIIVGYVTGGVARGIVVGISVLLTTMVFVDFPIHNIFIVVLVFILTSFLFSISGFINAMFANHFDDISIVPTFILTPMTYLGGIFYSIAVLPEFWQYASKFNPIYYMIDAFRYGFFGISHSAVSTSIMVIVLMIILLFFVALYFMNKGINNRA